MNAEIAGTCWKCTRTLTTAEYGRESTCLGCGKPTRACRNCRHFAPGRPNDCVEPMVAPVAEKERANFCELFDPTTRPVAADAGPAASDLVSAAQDLFK